MASADQEESLTALVFEIGAMGTSEVLRFKQPDGEEDILPVIAGTKVVDAYFASPPGAEDLQKLRVQLPELKTEVLRQSQQDWMAEWKKGFQPFPLAKSFWVVPSWENPPNEASEVIHMDPGMAFGTGTHATTQLVSEFLEESKSRGSFLDVGTGTGILAIMAYKMQFKDVWALEIDQEARRVAQENFALNSVTVTMPEGGVEDLSRRFSVVAANIIDGPLLRMRESLLARLEPGGVLLLSGILEEREPEFIAQFHLPGGRSFVERRVRDGWVALMAEV